MTHVELIENGIFGPSSCGWSFLNDIYVNQNCEVTSATCGHLTHSDGNLDVAFGVPKFDDIEETFYHVTEKIEDAGNALFGTDYDFNGWEWEDAITFMKDLDEIKKLIEEMEEEEAYQVWYEIISKNYEKIENWSSENFCADSNDNSPLCTAYKDVLDENGKELCSDRKVRDKGTCDDNGGVVVKAEELCKEAGFCDNYPMN